MPDSVEASHWSAYLRRLVLGFSCVVILVAGLVLLAYRSLGDPAVGIDDADIFFVYARNLAHGDGLVYNVGGERVEGFTSLLWVLCCAAGYRLTPHPENWLLALNVLLVAAALTALLAFVEWRIDPWLLGEGGPAVRSRPLFSVSQVVVLAWTLASPAFVVHTTVTLMDTGLWTSLFIVAGLLALTHGTAMGLTRHAFSTAVLLLVATRPEAILWAPVFVTAAFLRLALVFGDARRAARRVALPATVCTLAIVGVTVFRLAYFGQLLPNTYYAKVGPSLVHRMEQGFTDYLREFLRSNVFVPIFVLASIALAVEERGAVYAALRRLRTTRPAPPLEIPEALRIDGLLWSGFVFLGLLVPVYLGGDHFGGFRFYQPLWPLLVLPPLYLLVALRRRTTAAFGTVGLGHLKTAFLVSVSVLFHSATGSAWLNVPRRTGLAHEFRLAEVGQETGRVLGTLFETKRPSLGVYAAGGIALTYPGDVVDLLGLNLLEMAHAPGARRGTPGHAAFNRGVFYQLQPDLVFPEVHVLGDRNRLPDPFPETIVDGLFSDPRFLELYVRAGIEREPGGLAVTGWFRRAFVQRCQAEGLEIRIPE